MNAQTGSGKTLGFLLPILHHYFKEDYNERDRKDYNDDGYSSPKILVLTPTRELTCQIERELIKLVYNHNIK